MTSRARPSRLAIELEPSLMTWLVTDYSRRGAMDCLRQDDQCRADDHRKAITVAFAAAQIERRRRASACRRRNTAENGRPYPSDLPGKRQPAGHGRIGSMLRWLTAGESHGRALVAICEGVPAGVEVTTADLAAALARRRAGYGRGARMRFEQDDVELTAGVRHGRTLGGPVAITIGNTEWPKWEAVMAADPVEPEILASQARNEPPTRPTPGPADPAA